MPPENSDTGHRLLWDRKAGHECIPGQREKCRNKYRAPQVPSTMCAGRERGRRTGRGGVVWGGIFVLTTNQMGFLLLRFFTKSFDVLEFKISN